MEGELTAQPAMCFAQYPATQPNPDGDREKSGDRTEPTSPPSLRFKQRPCLTLQGCEPLWNVTA